MQCKLKRNIANLFSEGEIVRKGRSDGGLVQVFSADEDRQAWVDPDHLEPIEPTIPEPESKTETEAIDPAAAWEDFQTHAFAAMKAEDGGLISPLKDLPYHDLCRYQRNFSGAVGVVLSPTDAVLQTLFLLSTVDHCPQTFARIAFYILATELRRFDADTIVGYDHVLAQSFRCLYDIAHNWQNQPVGDGES